MFSLIFLLFFYVPTRKAQSTCPLGQKTIYHINIIDANVTNTSCSYRVFASSPGAGAYRTNHLKETKPGYVCFNTFFAAETLSGFIINSNTMCGETSRSGPLTNYLVMPLAEEFTMSNSYMSVQIYVQVICNGVALSSPRACANNFGSSLLEAGVCLAFTLFVLLIALFWLLYVGFIHGITNQYIKIYLSSRFVEKKYPNQHHNY